MITGNICEFGVYTGRSLALLSYIHEEYYKTEHAFNASNKIHRTLYGLDSFEGLHETEDHPRWTVGLFKVNHSEHPTFEKDEIVSPGSVIQFFKKIGLATPVIIKGYYNEMSPDLGSTLALVHIDCDLYSSTIQALNIVKTRLQTGTLILFDDWFNYRGGIDKGEQKAFSDFLKQNPNITAKEFLRYATFCVAFVLKVD